MSDPNHITSPDPNRSPYSHFSDADLATSYERVAVDPDAAEAPLLLAELQRRGLAK